MYNLNKRRNDASLQFAKTKEFKPIIDAVKEIRKPEVQIVGATDINLPAIEPSKSPTVQVISAAAYRHLRTRDPDPTGFELLGDEDKVYIGKHSVTFQGNDFIIDGVLYQGTPGLWHLLTKKKPDPTIYNEEDKENYLEIIFNSEAHLQENGRPRSSKSPKWKQLISPEYRKRTGSGIKFLDGDPESLENQLAVMIANLDAGHTNVDFSEFNAIADKLVNLGRILLEDYRFLLRKYFP